MIISKQGIQEFDENKNLVTLTTNLLKMTKFSNGKNEMEDRELCIYLDKIKKNIDICLDDLRDENNFCNCGSYHEKLN